MTEQLDKNYEALLNTAQEAMIVAAIEASSAVLTYWPSVTNRNFNPANSLDIINKGSGIGNFATAADHGSGDVIRKLFSNYPDLEAVSFRTEESALDSSARTGLWWNIDEIDGTANFSRGSDQFGISIGLHAQDGTPEVGIIAFPARQQLLVARRGIAAKLLNFDGTELADLTSHAQGLPPSPANQELFVTYDLGYSNRTEQLQTGALVLRDQVSALKSFHSSSYTLGELALGTVDAFFTGSPTIYDIGASTVLVEAIGGKVTDMQGNPIDWENPKLTFLAARTPQIHANVLDMLNQASLTQ